MTVEKKKEQPDKICIFMNDVAKEQLEKLQKKTQLKNSALFRKALKELYELVEDGKITFNVRDSY